MKTTSSRPISDAPQRLNRGTSASTPAKVSVMPRSSVAARLSAWGTFICASRTAAPGASVIFHSPAARKSAEMSTAAVPPNQLFQPGSSKWASKSPECAILSSMNLILALFSGLMGAQAADLVVTNARIYTLNPQIPFASAIAVKDGKVLAVGGNIEPYLTDSTRRIDAKGATIVPGLIDSHGHMRNLGESLEILDLRGAKSPE